MTAYCTIQDVKELTNIQAKHWFKKSETPDQDLNNMLQKWIDISSDFVTKYCNTTWSIENNDLTNIPSNIRLATCICVSNIIAVAQTRRTTPIIEKDNWSVGFGEFDIITNDVKELLDPFVKENDSAQTDFYCVSG